MSEEPSGAPADTDGDGIPDSADRCPTQAEDKDGFEDDDGCPDLDNDRNGIPDAQDGCPNEPETRNGQDDDDGCPEGQVFHPPMTLTTDPISFARNSAVVEAEGLHVLEQVVGLVRNMRTDLTAEIFGHADRREHGGAVLAQARARAVGDYLIEHGFAQAHIHIATSSISFCGDEACSKANRFVRVVMRN